MRFEILLNQRMEWGPARLEADALDQRQENFSISVHEGDKVAVESPPRQHNT
jgi:hypothetical protein